MLRIGLTGGIGSGKTTVLKIFQTIAVPTYEADKRARELMHSNELKDPIQKLFGNHIYQNDRLDRDALAHIVFNDKNKLTELNSIVHPAVTRDFALWSKEHRDQKYVIKEAAIIVETGGWRKLDGSILVTAPENIRINRVTQRDEISEVQVLSRMRNQWSDDKKRIFTDFEIINDGKKSVIEQVMAIHEILIS